MGTTSAPVPVKLIAGVLAASDRLLAEAAAVMAQRFGAVDALSAATDWDFSAYYRDDIGAQIRRQFLSFERLVGPGELAGLKHITNEMENCWRAATGRRVNIDPGYIAATKLVLASTKDAAHRVYLSDGIYAEATLQFASGSFQPYVYTYRDYAAAEVIAFFNAARRDYLAQLRVLR